MSAPRDARLHLDKAEEFLEAAESNQGLGLFNAAASAAVTSGINSKDAVCLAAKGFTGKSDSHSDAVGELRQSGPVGAAIAPTFNRLLSVKARAQYQTRATTAKGSRGAAGWAARSCTRRPEGWSPGRDGSLFRARSIASSGIASAGRVVTVGTPAGGHRHGELR